MPKDKDNKLCCKPSNTGHHLIEDHWVKENSAFPNYRSNRTKPPQSLDKKKDFDIKSINDAPCVCANKSRHEPPHGTMHNVQGVFEESYMPEGARHIDGSKNGGWNYGTSKEAALYGHAEAFPDSGCTDECLESQLDDFYGKDNSRSLNEPSKQGLGDDRDELKYVWSDVLDDGPFF